MKNDEKALIAGAGAILAYLFMEKNKEKKTDISDSGSSRHSTCTLRRKESENNRHHLVARSNILCHSIICYNGKRKN